MPQRDEHNRVRTNSRARTAEAAALLALVVVSVLPIRAEGQSAGSLDFIDPAVSCLRRWLPTNDAMASVAGAPLDNERGLIFISRGNKYFNLGEKPAVPPPKSEVLVVSGRNGRLESSTVLGASDLELPHELFPWPRVGLVAQFYRGLYVFRASEHEPKPTRLELAGLSWVEAAASFGSDLVVAGQGGNGQGGAHLLSIAAAGIASRKLANLEDGGRATQFAVDGEVAAYLFDIGATRTGIVVLTRSAGTIGVTKLSIPEPLSGKKRWELGQFTAHVYPGKGVLLQARSGNLYFINLAGKAATLHMLGASPYRVQALLGNGVVVREDGIATLDPVGSGFQLAPIVGGPALPQRMSHFQKTGDQTALFSSDTGLYTLTVMSRNIEMLRVPYDGQVYGIEMDPQVGPIVVGPEKAYLLRGTLRSPALRQFDYRDMYLGRRLVVPGFGLIGFADKLLYVTAPLSAAKVTMLDRDKYDGSVMEKERSLTPVFRIEHDCAPVLAGGRLRLRVTDPTGKQEDRATQLFAPRADQAGQAGQADVFSSVALNQPGIWSFQVVSQYAGGIASVGGPVSVRLRAPGEEAWGWAAIGGSLAFGVVALLGLVNLGYFLAARKYAHAWRVVSDGTFGPDYVRWIAGALSVFDWAQIWVLELYFKSAKQAALPPSKVHWFTLQASGQPDTPSQEVLAPPWRNKRIWLQGLSGMGKSALLEHVEAEYFQTYSSARQARRKWGGVLVVVQARNHPSALAGEAKPDWVLEAVSASLSKGRLTFSDRTMLERMLQSGIIAIAIDGLQEVGGSRAVRAFADRFPGVSMFVTSQDAGPASFATWKLPDSVLNDVQTLLEVSLDDGEVAAVVDRRITQSGLKPHISSGYEVRLIADLARAAPAIAQLPTTRIALYEEALRRGWPDAMERATTVAAEQTMAGAAAWRMLATRQYYQDKRRMTDKDEDLSTRLLEALAEAGNRRGSPRLVKKLGSTYEFMHDQLHDYLAARYLVRSGFGLERIENLLKSSLIWEWPPKAQTPLWHFVAQLAPDDMLMALLHLADTQRTWSELRFELKEEAERREREPT